MIAWVYRYLLVLPFLLTVRSTGATRGSVTIAALDEDVQPFATGSASQDDSVAALRASVQEQLSTLSGVGSQATGEPSVGEGAAARRPGRGSAAAGAAGGGGSTTRRQPTATLSVGRACVGMIVFVRSAHVMAVPITY